MDAISISAASGMKARMESLELLANNLANVETGGFKGDREFYSLYTSLDASTDPQTGDLTTLPVIEKHWTDLAQGDLHTTGNPLDFAIDGDGLFAIQTPRGIRYTRNGSFRLSATGVLTTIDGSSVRAKGGGQIQLQPGLPVQVQTDGSVSQGVQVAGQMELVTFSAGTVNKEGSNYWVPVPGVAPQPAKGSLLQGRLEGSNVGGPESAVRLVAIMRQFEMLQKAMSIGNDLNKRAIDEVARVQS
ncbi:MAG: flagellar basal-body rod protein FlgF [Bryobacterales bacterium]|jgi:flagellar basal body rod protein FlgG|nr:flagellar basal-body rod protein FlgF [Bryobacterales bacterium]